MFAESTRLSNGPTNICRCLSLHSKIPQKNQRVLSIFISSVDLSRKKRINKPSIASALSRTHFTSLSTRGNKQFSTSSESKLVQSARTLPSPSSFPPIRLP
ncbi:hypothetical protein CEXT_238221 [Caerostris extrusa]|uniref:Uncharacterized protein n=1 Tax=Caerostris extrusa TaxID=172846 RepID=A0AAV4MX57_CAEEX|nr:hypothetical protein CEXT_238221 [Caerostris extrusa]